MLWDVLACGVLLTITRCANHIAITITVVVVPAGWCQPRRRGVEDEAPPIDGGAA